MKNGIFTEPKVTFDNMAHGKNLTYNIYINGCLLFITSDKTLNNIKQIFTNSLLTILYIFELESFIWKSEFCKQFDNMVTLCHNDIQLKVAKQY